MFTKLLGSKVAFGIIMGMVAAFGVWWGVDEISDARYKKKCERVIADYVKLYQDCLNAPADTVYHIDTIYGKDTTKYRPKPKITGSPVALPPVTATTDDDTCECPRQNYYSEVYENSDFKIRWEASVTGSLDYIQFPDYLAKRQVATITKTVTIHDTAFIYKEKSHFGFYTLGATDFKNLPSWEAGMFYDNKKGWGLIAGYEREFQKEALVPNRFKFGAKFTIK